MTEADNKGGWGRHVNDMNKLKGRLTTNISSEQVGRLITYFS